MSIVDPIKSCIPTKVGKKSFMQLITIANTALTPTWQMEMNELAAPILLFGTELSAFSCINGRKNEPAML